MTAQELDEILKNAGISLPESEVEAVLPAANQLLKMANHLPDDTPETAHD